MTSIAALTLPALFSSLLCSALPSTSRLIGLQEGRFGYYVLITMLTNFASIMLGLSVSAVTADVDQATAVGVPLVILSILFGGFYISVDALPIVANWVPYITIFRWAYQAMCINEFKGLTFDCDAPNPEQCILSGEEVLRTLDFQGHSTAYPCFGLGMVLLGLFAIAFVNLELSTITYTPMGHTGSAFRKHAADGESGATGTAAAKGGGQPSYEMVPTSAGGDGASATGPQADGAARETEGRDKREGGGQVALV